MRLVWRNKGNYAYTTARVKAKKSLLITKDVYPKLLLMEIPEISRFLGETRYQREVTELGGRYSGIELVEVATYRNLARVFTDILEMSTGELREMICSYLNKWDNWNIKTILRGKIYGASPEEIQEDIVPAGKLAREYLSKLTAYETIEEILQDLAKKEGIVIPSEVLNDHKELGTLAPIEDYLDRLYYQKLLESISPSTKPMRLFYTFIQRELDVVNLGTILKLKIEGVSGDSIGKYVIPGGKEIHGKMAAKLINTDTFEQLAHELAQLSFYDEIKEALDKAKETRSLTDVMLALQRHLIRQASTFSHLYPLSVLPILDFMVRKKAEVDNIRIIARGKESGLDPDVIKRLLVM